MNKRHSTALVITSSLAALTLTLTGCFNGPNASTNMQSVQLTGNGVQVQAGDIRAENLTLVAGPDGSASATLIMRVTNQDLEADNLLAALIDGVPAFITGDVVELLPNQSVGFGYESDRWINSYEFDAPPSTYVPVALQFERSGIVEANVLVVPPTGYYEGIEPVPPAM